MASDDNVVKLKHLQPFANGISFPNGDNVVRLKHLVSLASAIADESIPSSSKTTPNLSLGGWSAVDTVYTAPITYDGDGALSVNVGSISNGSLIVADEDGSFSGVLTASAGESYVPAVATFNYNTDYVTVQGGGDIPDSIISSLGSKFVPTVSTSADFLDNAEDNIIFFDSKLKKFFETKNDFFILSDDWITGEPTIKMATSGTQESFLWGQTTVSTAVKGFSKYIISSATNNTIDRGSNANSNECLYFFKTSETTGYMYANYTPQGNYVYQGNSSVRAFTVNSNGSLKGGTAITIASAVSSVASHNHKRRIDLVKSCLSPNSVTLLDVWSTEASIQPSKVRTYSIDNRGNWSLTRNNYVIGTVRPNLNTDTLLDFVGFASEYPAVVQFDGQDVTVSKGSEPTTSPFLRYQSRWRRSYPSSDSITSGTDYVFFNAGIGTDTITSALRTATISGGVLSTLSPWLEDDGNFIHGTYPNKERNDCYVVTYKPGTYDKDTYLNDAFTVWNVDFITPRFVKSSKKLPDILDDIII